MNIITNKKPLHGLKQEAEEYVSYPNAVYVLYKQSPLSWFNIYILRNTYIVPVMQIIIKQCNMYTVSLHTCACMHATIYPTEIIATP